MLVLINNGKMFFLNKFRFKVGGYIWWILVCYLLVMVYFYVFSVIVIFDNKLLFFCVDFIVMLYFVMGDFVFENFV